MNKKLGKLLGKVFADKRLKADLGKGACCFTTRDGINICEDDVNQDYCNELWSGRAVFHPGKTCGKVCPENSYEDEEYIDTVLDPSGLSNVDTYPGNNDPSVDTGGGRPGGGDGGGDGGGGGGGPTPCIMPPASIPKDCEKEASEAAMCLEILQTGNTADQPTAKLLRGLVIGWGRYRCPELKALCYHAENGNVACYPDLTLTDMNCFCRIHNEYWKGLKRIVTEFCAGSLDGDTVRKRLTALCKQLKLARSRCQGNDGLPKDPISNSDNTGSLNCGIKRVD